MIAVKSDELGKYIRKKTAVALGSFDAIHKGHIAVIREAVEYAKQNGMLSLVQLFEVPPAVVGGQGAINSLDRRIRIIEELGADVVVVELFDRDFKLMEYTDFVTEHLQKHYNAGMVAAGNNYRFGHLAKGDAVQLKALCGQLGITVKILDCLKQGGIISSTRIREYIKSGDVSAAAEIMTRPYSIAGKVVHGRAIGRELGFPTANMEIPDGHVIPRDGVYKSRVMLDGEYYSAVTNVGAKPTVGCNEKSVETHIVGFCGDLYGKAVEVEFLKRIRDIKKFDDLSELSAQLKEDLKQI